MNIGARLKMIRKTNNLKLQQVGDIFDVTAQTLSRYENGVRTPDNDFLEAFGKHFKLSGNWLLYGESPIYKGDVQEKDVKELLLELFHLLESKEVKDIDIDTDFNLIKATDDIPENFLLMLKYMKKYDIIRKGILQFFYFFQKPLIDKYPQIFE